MDEEKCEVASMSLLLNGQNVLPAVHKLKDVEAVLASPFSYMVLLGGHLGQLKHIVDLASQHGKRCCCMPI